jgi:hypothetical protein
MSSSAVHDQTCDELAGFNLNAYVVTSLAIKSQGRIRLRFDARDADEGPCRDAVTMPHSEHQAAFRHDVPSPVAADHPSQRRDPL